MNELVSAYRQQFPDDPQSDDQITLSFANELGVDALKAYPNALKDLERLNAPSFTAGEYAKQFGGELIRGVTGTLATIPESIAIAGEALNRAVPMQAPIPAEQDVMYGLGGVIRRAGEAISPKPVPGLEKSFGASQLPQGFGSALTFAGGGIATTALKIPRLLGIAGLGAMAGAAQGYQDAKEKGATEEQALASAKLNALAGLSEGIPLERILSRAEKWSGGKLWKAVLDAGAGSLEEGLQNAFQGEAGNQIAKRIVGYDKDREEFKDLLQNTEVGGAVGGIVSLLASAVGVHLNRLKTEEPKKVEKVEKAVPGITTAPPPATAVAPPVTIPNQDVVENYIGALPPERKDELARIAQNKIDTGVDLSAGLPPQDQAAVRIIEGILRQGKTEQETANVTANLQAMSLPDLIAQRDVMVAQGFDPAQIAEINKVISEKGGEQNAESVRSNEIEVPQGGVIHQVGGTEGGQNLQLAPQAGTEAGEPLQRLTPEAAVEPPVAAQPVDIAAQARAQAAANLVTEPEVIPKAPEPPAEVPTPPEMVSASTAATPEAVEPAVINLFLDPKNSDLATKATSEVLTELQKNPEFEKLTPEGQHLALAKALTVATYEDQKAGKTEIPIQPASAPEGSTSGVRPEAVPGTGPEKLQGVAEDTGPGTSIVGSGAPVDTGIGKTELTKPQVVISPAVEAERAVQAWGKYSEEVVKPLEKEVREAEKLVNEMAFDARRTLPGIKPKERLTKKAFMAKYGVASMDEASVQFKDKQAALAVKTDQLEKAKQQLAELNRIKEQAGKNWSTAVSIQKEAEAKAKSQLKVGDAAKIMGVDSILAKTETIGGVRYDLFNGAKLKEKRAALRVTDVDSGNVVTLEQHPTFDRAEAKYNETISAANKAQGPLFTGPELIVPQPGRVSTAQELEQFKYVLEGMALQGLNLQVGRDALGRLVAEYGIYDNARRLVTLSLADVQNPTRSNLIAALHEALHAVSAQETPQMQQRLHLAIEGLKTEGLTSPGSVLAAEEHLVQSTAVRFANAGMEMNRARSFARRVWDLLKELYLKAAIIVQQALHGPQHVRQELAQAYLASRLARFLRGENLSAGFLDSLGGGNPTHVVQAGFHSQVIGSGWEPEYFNWETNTLEYPESIEDSLEAVRYNRLPNVLYKDVEMILDPRTDSLEPQEVAIKVATQNGVKDVRRKMYDEWTRVGHNRANLSYADWHAANFRGENPDAIIADQTAWLQAHNIQPVPETTKVDDLLAQSSKDRAINLQRLILDKQRTQWSERRTEAESSTPSDQAKLTKSITRLLDLTSRFTVASEVARQTAATTAEIVNEFKSDISDIKKLAETKGMLKQIIEQIDGKLDGDLSRQYRVAIERLFKKFVTDTRGEKLVDLLDSAVAQDIDWKNEGVETIRNTLAAASEADPKLLAFVGMDVDSKALLSLAVAFGKSNDGVIDYLNLRKGEKQEDLAKVKDALSTALSDSTDAINKARRDINAKVPKLAAKAERILVNLEKVKKEHRRLLDRIKAASEFIDLHQDTLPVINSEMAKLENALGAMTESWEPTHGAVIPVPVAPTSTWEQAVANSKTLALTPNGTTSGDVRTWLPKIKAWLDAQPPDQHGSNWNNLNRAYEKIQMIDTRLEHDVLSVGTFQRLLGSIRDKLEFLGLPSAKLAANRVRRKVGLVQSHKNYADREGVKVDKAEGAAMKALGWKGSLEQFRRRYYHDVKGYIEHRKDILARNANRADAITEVKSALFAHLSHDPTTAAQIRLPGAWDALMDYLDLTANNNGYVIAQQHAPEFGLKTRDEEAGIFRKPIGDPFFDNMRRVAERMGAIVAHMRPEWGGTATLPMTKGQIAQAHRADPAATRAALAPRFTPEVWQEFVRWLAYEPGKPNFYAPEVGGVNPIAKFAKEAFDATTPGDAVGFAENLYALEGGTSDLSDFVGETLNTLQNYYGALASTYADENQVSTVSPPVPARVAGDARKSEAFPAQWMEYQLYGSREMRHMIELLSFEAAYGRNMVGMEKDLSTAEAELKQQEREYDQLVHTVQERLAGKPDREVKGAITAAAKAAGIDNYRQARRNLQTLTAQRDQFHALIKMQAGVAPEMRSWFEMVSAMAGQAVQGYGTALTDLVTSVEQPFRLLGVTPDAFAQMWSKGKFAASDLTNSLFQAFGNEYHMQAEHAKRLTEIGAATTDQTMRLKDKMISAMRTEVDSSFQSPIVRAIETGLTRFSRVVRVLNSTGIGRTQPGRLVNSPTLKLTAPFTFENEIVHRAEMVGWFNRFEHLVRKAMDFYRNNPQERADPNYELTSKDVGYFNYLFGFVNRDRAFKQLKQMMGNYGVSLELAARSALDNPDQPIFTKQQYQALSAVVRQEVTLESDESNLPAIFFTNPVLILSRPLIGWSIGKSNAFLKGFREPNGVRDWASIRAGLITLFAAAVPVGLAFAMIRDKWDEKVIGKKANVAGFGQGNDWSAMMDKLSRVGTFGIAAEPINAILNQQTTRPFSFDSRVFFMSSMLNAVSTMGTWWRQGSATYSTVYRPMMSSLGGSGFLQTVDILNNALGLDNAESRVVARINANNYLRAAGREIGLDVRKSGGSGGQDLSTRTRPHVSNMLFSALANDYESFREAYERAIASAVEDGKPDPADYVKRSFATYHPLRSVFRTPPSEAEYRGILSSLNDRGQQDVSQAIDLYNRYAALLGIKAFDGKKDKPRITRVSPEEARLRAALGLQQQSIFAR